MIAKNYKKYLAKLFALDDEINNELKHIEKIKNVSWRSFELRDSIELVEKLKEDRRKLFESYNNQNKP